MLTKTTTWQQGAQHMINQDSSEATNEAGISEQALVLLFCTDLMFGVQLQQMAVKAGLRHVTLRPGAPLPRGSILVVDLSSRGDWESAIREAANSGTQVVAFGPHMDTTARRRAKEAGASRVLANSNLARDLPVIFAGLRHEK